MNIEILDNGNLKMSLEDGDLETCIDIKDSCHHLDHGFIAEILERFGFSPNGQFYPIMPVDVGALTDAPMLSDDVDYLDDGTINVRGNVWWFPSYELESFAEILIDKGSVTFTAAPENKPVETPTKAKTHRM